MLDVSGSRSPSNLANSIGIREPAAVKVALRVDLRPSILESFEIGL